MDANKRERKLLWTVLLINFFLFLLEIITGLVGHSMGLMADSLDMLADAIVYGLALLAVGGLASTKRRIAEFSGYLQLLLAFAGFAEVIRRAFGFGQSPDYRHMVIVSILALIGNSICVYLLKRRKSDEVHMKAAMIFTSNDVLINVGVIVAGFMVLITEVRWPDLLIGTFVFVLVTKEAFKIFRLSREDGLKSKFLI